MSLQCTCRAGDTYRIIIKKTENLLESILVLLNSDVVMTCKSLIEW